MDLTNTQYQNKQPNIDLSVPRDEQPNPNSWAEMQSGPVTPNKKKLRSCLQANSPRFTNKAISSPAYYHEGFTFGYDSTDVTHSCVAAESINRFSNFPVIEHLDLTSFKTKPCPSSTQHNHRQCPYYHNSKDKKRPNYFYSADLCEYVEAGENCPNGEQCAKAHSRVEQLYRPEKYKTKFCTFYPNNLEKCEYGVFCSFAHDEIDISIELIHNYEYDDDFYMFHYKTVWCPFNLTQHDKALCVYAHNWQDYRRKPNTHNYEASPCSNWKSTDFIVNYEDGCSAKEKCNRCHGWKELEYHPMNYKTKPCPNGKNCSKGRDCTYYHTIKDRRSINTVVANGIFKFYPRNRIITGTFKVRSSQVNPNPSYSNNSIMTYSQDNDSTTAFSNYSLTSPQKPKLFSPRLDNDDPTLNFPLDKMEKPRRAFSYFEGYLNNHTENTEEAKNSNSVQNFSPGVERDYRLRTWSTDCIGSLDLESDKIFKEIIFSSVKKDNVQKENLKSPKVGTLDDIPDVHEPSHDESDLKHNIMLDKILDS